jgi:3D (Asp-Asp-Asp) domain-containing protein
MRKIIILLLMIILIISFSQAKEKYFIMQATGYCPCEICCEEWSLHKRTYTGDKAGKGCIAIDPEAKILKLGQSVEVEGYGKGICNDIGGAIKGWEIDLCFDTHQEAIEWGRKLVKVFIIN